MKIFRITTAILFACLLFAMFCVVAIRVEEQRDEIEAHKRTINDLGIELHKTQVIYLKYRASVQTEQHGAHYVDGKIKFYDIKN